MFLAIRNARKREKAKRDLLQRMVGDIGYTTIVDSIYKNEYMGTLDRDFQYYGSDVRRILHTSTSFYSAF